MRRNNNKRKRPSEPIDPSLPGLPQKRPAHDAPAHSTHGGKPITLFRRKAPVDKTSGQFTAFPGLELDDDDIEVEGMPLDGLSYLRMVRKEAKTVPSVMVAGAEGKFFEDSGYDVGVEEEEEEEVFSGVMGSKYEEELEEELKELDYLNYDDEVADENALTEPNLGTVPEKKEDEEDESYAGHDYYDSSDL